MAASLAALLQARGYKVRLRKLDPYLNVDPGTMSPYQHGEVYVTDDGAETDLDLGHYERFTGVPARQSDNVTSGRIYQGIIQPRAPRRLSRRHRPGHPARHQRDQGFHPRRHRGGMRLRPLRGRRHRRRHRIPALHRGDPPVPQRARRAAQRLSIHTTLVPYIAAAGELKTKPTQHSVRELTSPRHPARDHRLPLRPRAARERPRQDLQFLQRPHGGGHPRARREEHLRRPRPISRGRARRRGAARLRHRGRAARPTWPAGTTSLDRLFNPEGEVTIGVVGKYVGLQDAYKSLTEALVHGGLANRVKVNITLARRRIVRASRGARSPRRSSRCHAILVPGGFGERGSEGKIASVHFARERDVPFFGICLGMQMACIEAARNTAGLRRRGLAANSARRRSRSSA